VQASQSYPKSHLRGDAADCRISSLPLVKYALKFRSEWSKLLRDLSFATALFRAHLSRPLLHAFRNRGERQWIVRQILNYGGQPLRVAVVYLVE
jgi:hypothetical protein